MKTYWHINIKCRIIHSRLTYVDIDVGFVDLTLHLSLGWAKRNRFFFGIALFDVGEWLIRRHKMLNYQQRV